MLLLQLFELRLEGLHRELCAGRREREREQHEPDDDGKEDDSDAHVGAGHKRDECDECVVNRIIKNRVEES